MVGTSEDCSLPPSTQAPKLQPKWVHPDVTWHGTSCLICLLPVPSHLVQTLDWFHLSVSVLHDRFGSFYPIPWTSDLVLFVHQLGLTSET